MLLTSRDDIPKCGKVCVFLLVKMSDFGRFLKRRDIHIDDHMWKRNIFQVLKKGRSCQSPTTLA